MSLIDEALKRAQRAADREAPRQRPWVPTPLPDAGLARRRRLVRSTMTGLGAGLGLAALVALLVWAARGSDRRVAENRVAPAAAPAPAARVPVPTEVRSGADEGAPPPARAAGAAILVRTPSSGASTPAAPRLLVPSIETTPVHVGPPPRAAEALASASGSPRARPAAAAVGKSYHGKVDLPDGGSLELGGIVWSEADPRALVNDRVVGVGAYVQGYTIETIQEDRVVLEKDGKRITVLVK